MEPKSVDVDTLLSKPEIRDLGDPAAHRKSIYDLSLAAVSGWEPIQHGNITLEFAPLVATIEVWEAFATRTGLSSTRRQKCRGPFHRQQLDETLSCSG